MADKADIDPIRRGLGLRLASARKNKKYTQDQVADKFSVNKATVSAWETGRGIPDALTLRSLAKLYDTSADSLLWEDSLSNEAMQIAASFDSLNDRKQQTFRTLWMAFLQDAMSDEGVEQAVPAIKDRIDAARRSSMKKPPFDPAHSHKQGENQDQEDR